MAQFGQMGVRGGGVESEACRGDEEGSVCRAFGKRCQRAQNTGSRGRVVIIDRRSNVIAPIVEPVLWSLIRTRTGEHGRAASSLDGELLGNGVGSPGAEQPAVNPVGLGDVNARRG